MKQLLEKLNQVEGVKNVKKRSGPTLRINLFSRPVPGREAEEIQANLQSTSQKIRAQFETAKKNSEIENWNWIQKPEKKYEDTPIQTEKVKDRKSIGYKPAYYTVSIQV